MKVKMQKIQNKQYVEVPNAIVNLYSLEEGQIFEAHAKENKEILLIILSTKLNE